MKATHIFLAVLALWAGSVTAGTIVRFETVMGNFDVELFDDETPVTVANFLSYVNNGDYVNTMIHRASPEFVIQGGRHFYDGTPRVEPRFFPLVPSREAIPNEPVRSNLRGTLAMAKRSTGIDPVNSATNQWYINLADNTELDQQNGGFTVFGEVLGDGMAVVDAIAELDIYVFEDPWGEAPLRNYTLEDYNSFRPINDDHLVIVNRIFVVDPNGEQSPVNAVVPWVVNNENFTSKVSVFNNSEEPIDVLLKAVSTGGSVAREVVTIPGKTQLARTSAELFPGFNGYALFVHADITKIFTSFRTIAINNGANVPSLDNVNFRSELTEELLFGYVPGDEIAAAVLVATGFDDASTPVTLTLYGGDSGTPLGTANVSLNGIQPNAILLRDLFDNIPTDATLSAVSTNGTPITGTTFVFNNQGQPSMASAYPVNESQR